MLAMVAIGAAAVGCLSTASANAIYDAETIFTLILRDVSDAEGSRYDSWSVVAEEYFIDGDVFTSGDGIVSVEDSIAANCYRELGVGDDVTQFTHTSGASGEGIAESYVLNELGVQVENDSLEELTFTFDYKYLLSASVGSATHAEGDDALAYGGIDVVDDFFSVDILDEAYADLILGPEEDKSWSGSTFSFTLSPGDYNYISIFSYSSGIAIGAQSVPEPATLALLGIGLVCLGISRARKIS